MALSTACALAMGYNGFFSRSPTSFVAEDNTECYRLETNECGNNNAWGYVVGPSIEGTERTVEFYVQTSKAPSSLATALFQSTVPAAYQVLRTRYNDATKVVTADIIVYACTLLPVPLDFGVPVDTGFEQVGVKTRSNVDREYGIILVVVMTFAVLFVLAACVITRRPRNVIARCMPQTKKVTVG